MKLARKKSTANSSAHAPNRGAAVPRKRAGRNSSTRASNSRSEEERRGVRAALLRWYRAHHRDLPWRRTRDPYSVWISENMLQQTRVETVIPYYERFMKKFPDVFALASADRDAVLGIWAGLGYYGRARNLHAAAQRVVDEFDGRLPCEVEVLRALPGIGRYTAGAVASIAFDRPEPAVDGNVVRVLARLYGIRNDVKQPQTAEALWKRAAELVRGRAPGDFNQALMELGATICTPRAPRCLACPLARWCNARRNGDAESLPVKAAKVKPKLAYAVAALLLRRGRLLAVRRPPRGLLGGLWELPGGSLLAEEKPERGLLRCLRETTGLHVNAATPLGVVEHVFSHRYLFLHVFHCRESSGRVRLQNFDAHRWLLLEHFTALPQATVTRKAFALCGASGAT